jgi:tetratricopeptide (TPR) repeat protein
MARWFRIAMWLATSMVRGGDEADSIAAAGVREFMAAYQDWDDQRFAASADLFRRANARDPGKVVYHYWLGAAEFHRMLRLSGQPGSSDLGPGGEAARDAAIEALKRAVDLDEAHAESQALLGTLYGMMIDGNLIRALRFGPRVSKCQKRAMEHGPNNPRVRYLLGMGQFHTAKKPAAWREALDTLLKAEKLFEAEQETPTGPLDPRWGHASCQTFIGRTYEILGESRRAATYFRKALVRQPSDHTAREGLQRVTSGE